MKIAYVCADRGIPLLGDKGASVHLRSLAAALTGRGNLVTIVCANLRDANNPPPAGVRIEEMPDSVDAQRDFLIALFSALEPDVVLERYSLSSGPAQVAARTNRIPFVLEVNAPLVDEAARYRGLVEVERWRTWERQVLASADRLIAVSPAIRSHLLELAIDPERVTVIHNGVNLASFEGSDGRAIRIRHGLDDAIVVGFSGSLKPWHGVDTLIQAVATLPAQVRLLIVGDGPQRADLETLATSRLRPGQAIFAGAVPHSLVPAHMAAMDMGVAPYLPQEDFYFSPLKVIEYLAAGLPVVASDQGDLRMLVGEAGILVPAGDEAGLASAIDNLSTDPHLRRRLAEAARPLARDRDWAKVAARVEGVLGSLREAA